MNKTRPLFLLAAITIFAGGYASGLESAQKGSQVEDEVRAVLDRYVVARNTFNADAFLGFFQKSPNTVVVSATSEYIGWDALRKGIQPLFESRASTTQFQDVRVYPFGNNIAVVYHHYTLKTSKGTASPSRSTKVFYRFPEGWKVVSEHSSRVPNFVSANR